MSSAFPVQPGDTGSPSARTMNFDRVLSDPGTWSGSNLLIEGMGRTDPSQIFSTHIRILSDAAQDPGNSFAANDPVNSGSNPIPEPGTMVLLGISLITVAGYIRRVTSDIK